MTDKALLFIVLILMLIAALPRWDYSREWGPYPASGVGAALFIIVVLFLLGKI